MTVASANASSPEASAMTQPASKTVPVDMATPVIRCRIDITAGNWNRHTDKCGDKGRALAIESPTFLPIETKMGIRNPIAEINPSVSLCGYFVVC